MPGLDDRDANPYCDIVIPTGLHLARNALVVSSADAVVALGATGELRWRRNVLGDGSEGNLTYGLTSGGRSVLSGDVRPTESVPAGGSSRLKVPATLVFADLLAAVSGLRPGAVVPYEFDAQLDVDTPLGPLSLPLRKQGELPVPAVPELALESVQWGRLSMDEATATLKLRVGNTNDFALDLASMAYDLALGGHSIVSTSLSKPTSFGADESAVVEVPISFKPMDLGFAVFKLLTGDGAGYALKGDMLVDTPFGPLTMPFDVDGETTFLN